MEQLVSYETAKLAKELEFDVPVQNRFRKDGGLNDDLQRRYGQPMNYNDPCFQDIYRKYTSVPTQSELFKWLLENHQLFVSPVFNIAGYTYNIYDVQKKQIEFAAYDNNCYYENHHIAFENGLKLALSIAKKNKL